MGRPTLAQGCAARRTLHLGWSIGTAAGDCLRSEAPGINQSMPDPSPISGKASAAQVLYMAADPSPFLFFFFFYLLLLVCLDGPL
jgi:hypothetical protein